MAVYTSRVRGRVRAMYTAEYVRTDGPYTVVYTDGVDGRYTAVYRPFSRAMTCSRAVSRAVYTAAV